ncbi:cell wall-binding repeat-containing protein [Clostridium sporogenes]|uniref:cell wall-binding repeat-containing protein n=2 Tax=Clostridium sporogenes TaxID=1509 RepID=UPI0007749BFA|nr:cell wall-binding repeat-containing protein [Clostridium sporogenes]MCW6125049.1 cell wall-binding repeat-containing protein [Clostridium sporogenes]NFD94356.1 cell wall-binding repeat-containing protein [Clostridium sporogenes]NFE47099.1 cell wall-binding repeat-containing protein [Clostridium sporogenes]NFF16422.1 cell wall-binding repeat-containing protein [Clostridium sporogenes]NFF73785.1 cell wall-binding repeat-containing protein [Clostridium sporogenes]
MKKTSKALASTAALCLVLSTSSVFAAENTAVAPERLAGANRVDTAVKIAEKSFNEAWKGQGNAILSAAADANLVDSLAVAPLSYQLKAPILLNDAKDSINADTLKALKANNVKTVYIATGEGVISNKAKAQLEKEGFKVERLGGKNRYETAKNILDTFKKNGGDTKNVALVSGSGLADALSVAPEAARKGMPILLTDGKDAVAANLAEVAKAADKVYAIGGNGIISDALVQQLKADRVSGHSRYETNAAVIKKFAGDKEFSKIYLGNGQDGHLVDSLTGSVLAAQSGSPIVLADGSLVDATKDALKGKVSDKTGVVALGGEAVVSNDLVKEVTDIAKPEVNKVAAESVVSLNETSVQVKGLAKDTKEADLKDKKIELKAGDITLTAKYVQSSLTEDGKANFVLENGKKLVDTTEYTVESDWAEFVVNKFVAKVVNPYVKTINVTTKAIQAKANNNVYFEAKNQYGEEIAVNGNVKDVKVTATINGVPVKETEITKTNINDGYITITNELKEGDDVFVSFINKIGDEDVKVGTATFKVVKAEDAVATEISNMKAEYTSEANGHKTNEEAKEVLPDDQIKLSAKISDQFGNPMPAGTKARWVVEAGKDLVTKIDASAIDEVSDSVDFTFKAIKAGDLKVSAYLANGKKVTYEVKIGAKKLEVVKVEGESGINIANVAGINHEEKIVGVVNPNKGAILTPDMIKFDIKATKTSEEVKPSDVEVVAKLRGGEKDNKNDIVISVKSTKVGKYVITPYVGESVEKGIKGDIITVTTTIDQKVASIDDISFDAAELKTGTEIKKDIVFRNKHKEVLVLDDNKAIVTVTPEIADAANNAKVTKDADKNKNILTLKADGAKTYNVVVRVKDEDVIKAFNLTFKAPTFTAVELGNDVNGVVAGDPVDKAKYQEVKFLDQDGKTMTVNKEDIKVSATKPDGQPLTDISKLITLGKTYTVDKDGKVTFDVVANEKDHVVAMKVAPAEDVVPGTYTVKVEDKDGKISDTLNITVGSKRIAKTVEIKPAATKVVFGGKVKVNIVPKDQYGEFIVVGKEKVEVLPGTNFEASAITEINKDGGAVDAEHPLAGYQVELTGKTKGTNDVVVNIKEADKVLSTNKVSMTVDSAAGLIDSVAVDTKDIKSLYSTKAGAAEVDLNAIVKDADGTVIPVSDSDLDWKVVSQKDAEGKDVSSKTVIVDSKTGKVTATKDTVGTAVIEVTTANMKKANITLKFDNKESVAQKGTVEVINTVKTEDGKTLLPLDADDKKEGIQISLDNDAKDGEKDGAVKVVLNAKDQYGNLLGDQDAEIKADQITLRVGDSSVVKAEVDTKDPKGVITITAKGEGDSKVYVEYAGQTIALDVTANKAAVDAAKSGELKEEAEKSVGALETAAAKDLTIEANLKEAEEATKTAKDALDKLPAGTEGLAELTNRFNAADNKVKAAKEGFSVKQELEAAKTAIEGATYTLDKVNHNEVAKAKTAVGDVVNNLPEVKDKGFTVTVKDGDFVAAQDGASDGSYKFTVKLEKAGQEITSSEKTVVIPQ